MNTHLTLRIWGPQALWADPHFKADPYTYAVPTPSGIKGILRAVYWKPEGEWEIDSVAVLAPIRYDTTKMRVLAAGAESDEHTLQTLTTLVDVNYLVRARFVVNPLRADRVAAWHSYMEEAKRRMTIGQSYRPLSLGRREYIGYYELVDDGAEAAYTPIPVTRDLGSMLFDLIPVDLGVADGKSAPDKFQPVFFRAALQNGVVHYPRELYDRYREQTMTVRHRAHAARK